MTPPLLWDLPPAAARSDPPTSWAAASDLDRTGARARQVRRVATLVAERPGRTSRELATEAGEDRYMVARRLPDAEAVGLVRRGPARACAASGKQAITWWPVTEDRR